MTSQDAVLPNRHQRPKHSGTSQNPGSKPTRPVRGRASAPALQLISSRMVPQQQEVRSPPDKPVQAEHCVIS